jgi:hypothetical protein
LDFAKTIGSRAKALSRRSIRTVLQAVNPSSALTLR